MNKIIVLISLCLCATDNLFSQEAYVKIGGAYRFSSASDYIGTNYISDQSGSLALYGEQGIYKSFGAGKEINCAIGVTGKTLGMEIGLAHVFKSVIDVTYSDAYRYETGEVVRYSATDTYENSMLAINPCMVIVFPVGFYGRAGAIVGIPTYTAKRHVEGRYTYESTRKYQGSPAVGLTGSVGYAVPVAGVKLYIEGDLVSLTWAPQSSELTQYTENGKDALSTLRPWMINSRYVDGGPEIDTDVIYHNEYHNLLKSYHSYSSIGLKAGIMIDL